jgi:hypothetical protein
MIRSPMRDPHRRMRTVRRFLSVSLAACVLLAGLPAGAAEIRTFRSSNAPFIDRTYGTDTSLPSFEHRMPGARTAGEARERHYVDRYGYHGTGEDTRNRIIVPQARRAPMADCRFRDDRQSSEPNAPAYRCRLQ